MIPDEAERYHERLMREIDDRDDTLPFKDEYEYTYPYEPFLIAIRLHRVYNSEGSVVHNPPLHMLSNNTLQKWIDLAYVAVTETKGIHLAIRSSANQLIDDFSRELVMREETHSDDWDWSLPL